MPSDTAILGPDGTPRRDARGASDASGVTDAFRASGDARASDPSRASDDTRGSGPSRAAGEAPVPGAPRTSDRPGVADASAPHGDATPAAAAPLLDVAGLAKRYGATPVFAAVDLRVAAGEFVAILGESGVGKSTLLNCIAGLDRVDAGRVRIAGTDITVLAEAEQAHFRRDHLGFVFQAFHVLPHLTVADNVALPLLLQHRPDPARVAALLAAVGLDGLGARLPQTLSGGQLQRVAIARALVHRPQLILADEPTGNLDPATAQRVMALLAAQVKRERAACVLVTHSRAAAACADRVLTLTADGMTGPTP